MDNNGDINNPYFIMFNNVEVPYSDLAARAKWTWKDLPLVPSGNFNNDSNGDSNNG